MVTVQAVCPALGLEGAVYEHRTIGGVARRVKQPAGQGWTWRVAGSRDALVALGAYETDHEWLLEIRRGADPIRVHVQ